MIANPFIYFSGDSFMAGSELADDTLQCWKDMFGTYRAGLDARYHTEFSQAKRKEAHDWSDSQHAEYWRCQRDRHWTTIVCDKHGIKHYNDGVAGSSQESVLHRAVISFDKFERDGNVPTLAIIQLTDPGRATVYKDSTKIRPEVLGVGAYVNGGAYYEMIPRHTFDNSYMFQFAIKNPIDAIRQYTLAHMGVESEIGNIVRWLTTLAITNSFFKEKTGRYPIYLESYNMAARRYIHKAENEVNIVNTPEYRSLIHQARLYTINSNIWDLSHDKHLLCPGGHHTPQTHTNFAQFIESHLLQELNNG